MRSQLTLFVDLRPQRPLAGVSSSLSAPFVIEEIVELENMDALKALCHRLNPKVHYTRSLVGCYPENRFLRHVTLENPSKAREDNFFEDFLKSQYQIELSDHSVMVLNPATGVPVDFEKVVPKEMLITGAPQKEIATIQSSIVENAVYPDRLELGTLSTIGGLMHYLRVQQIGSCAAHLEWGQHSSLFTICSAKRVELSRVIPFGTGALMEEIKTSLHLKDITNVQKFLSASSFDFKEMAPQILKRFIKELQASAGFFEVQTGQPLKHFVLTLVPSSLGWVEPILSQYMGLDLLAIDYVGWANTLGIKFNPEKIKLSELTHDHLGLVSLMINTFTESDAEKRIS